MTPQIFEDPMNPQKGLFAYHIVQITGFKIHNFGPILKRLFPCDRNNLAHHAQWSKIFFEISKMILPLCLPYIIEKNISRRKCQATFFDWRLSSPVFGPFKVENFT